MEKERDVIIVGGGPAGSACAMYLEKAGVDVLLLDSESFPRDKICGDAQGGKAMKVMRELGLHRPMDQVPHTEVNCIIFSSPKGTVLSIPRKPKEQRTEGTPSGYTSRRKDFDNMLFQEAKKRVETREGFTVTDLVIENGFVKGVKGNCGKGEEELRAKLVVGADGAASIVARKLGVVKNPDDHDCISVRGYYQNVEGLSDGIEIHFVPELIPGYFWVFPLPNKCANVGVGMVFSDMKRQKTNLKEALLKIVRENPLFKERFRNARLEGELRGWTLPFGSYRRKLAYNGAVLLGDAAGLIDPFSGEGVGNAMMSARAATPVIATALASGDVSEAALKPYADSLWEAIGPELKQSYKLQKLGKHRFLLNLVVDKAARSQEIRDTITEMLVNEEARKKFNNLSFYVKLLIA